GFKCYYLIKGLNDDLGSLERVCIKSMQRLAQLMHYKVSNIYYIIYRTNANGIELVLQPHGRIPDSNVFYIFSKVSVAFLWIRYANVYFIKGFLLFKLCRSEERRVGKECSSRW